jgi:hypothetical protein
VAKAFFCHASEDKAVVEAVYKRVLASASDVAAWLDKYEILAGESLIKRIAAGMDESDKFVIFLSPTSIRKPWVDRELRRAIMREINGVDPDFIVPVLIGDIDAVPAFLEDKKYIALHKMKEEEWLAELVAAIRGIRPVPGLAAQAENVVVHWEPVVSQAHAVRLVFEARFWAVKASFGVTTSENIREAYREWPDHRGAGLVTEGVAEHHGDRFYGFQCVRPTLRPGYRLELVLEFAPGTDAMAAIEQVGHWDPHSAF